MTMHVQADPSKLEAAAQANQETMLAIVEKAKSYGLIAHRFYGNDDGQVMVADEWPDVESFQRFFEATQSEIQPMMIEAGATAPPVITYWRKLAVGDDHGWGA
jgi:hypothetical protein